MDQGFWKELKKPFFVLAPMADVTDAVFRKLIAKYSRHGEPEGGPDVFWTEFVSADGLASRGKDALMMDLRYTEGERPIVAQIFGARPENIRIAASIVRELGFDGVDLNMGCPDRNIEKQGSGAAHIKDAAHAREIIRAAKEGAGDLPVSAKTRVGYNKDQIDEWIPELLSENIAALTIHARTRKEMSNVPARWEDVARVVKIRDEMGKDTLIIGNGDVKDMPDARAKVAESGADGAMLGRAIFGNPWLFDTDVRCEDISVLDQLKVMIEHTKLYESELGGLKNFAIMKKHYKAYVAGFDGAKELRMELMEAKDAVEVEQITQGFLETYRG